MFFVCTSSVCVDIEKHWACTDAWDGVVYSLGPLRLVFVAYNREAPVCQSEDGYFYLVLPLLDGHLTCATAPGGLGWLQKRCSA